MGELSEDDPEIKSAQVHMRRAKEERSLSDCLQRFLDWKSAVRAIARLKIKFVWHPVQTKWIA